VNINSTLDMNGQPLIDSTGLLTLSSSDITLNANTTTGSVTVQGAAASLTAYDNIAMTAGKDVTISSIGGNITLNALSTSDSSGSIGIGADNSISIFSRVNQLVLSTAEGDILFDAHSALRQTAGNDITISSTGGNINIVTPSTSIALTQDITLTGSTIINNTLKLDSSLFDNNASSGTAGQVLTAGTGGQVIWSTITGSGGWVSTATSPLNMNTYQINNISSASSATDVPQINNVQSAVNIFPAGTNGWSITPADQFTIYQNSFGGPSSTLVTYGNIYNGTPYQGNTSHILPPSKFSINFRCPVATSTTPLGPGTNWPINVPYYIRCELLSYNAGTGIVLSWLDTQTVTGWVYNTGPPNNIPYLSFNVILCSNTSVPIDSAGNGRVIALNFTLASVNASGLYAFYPNANGNTYQDCAGIEVSVTTLAGTTGSGF
jgi:hypothetical protein